MTTYSRSPGNYIPDLFAQHDEVLQYVWEETPKQGLPAISIRPEEGRFLQLMAQACGARRALEIGTLGGYSGIWIARGLQPGGQLITLEKDHHHAAVARRHFALAGLEQAVEVRVGPALNSLAALKDAPIFDFVFIDADKQNYIPYLQLALELTRPGGVITAHNALGHGNVPDPTVTDEFTEQMRAFNRYAAGVPGLISTIYPAGDGTLVAVKST